MSEFETVQPKDVPANAQLIDVREADEFNDWHAVGATNIPLSELQVRYSELDLNEDIYVICLSGGARKTRSANTLATTGCTSLHSLVHLSVRAA